MIIDEIMCEDKNVAAAPRLQRVLTLLRARHPQARTDLEALAYEFLDAQKTDRREITRLDQENDQEEEDIRALERAISVLKKRPNLQEKKDACYHKVRGRYKVWPSAYASGALVQCRKKGAANWGTGGKKNESN